MKYSVFFSWQADRPAKEGRSFIERALKAAVKNIANDTSIEEAIREDLMVDKDTKGVPGHPAIFNTILEKISDATIFVPDLTFVGDRCNGRPTPNPNVLIEFGWALKAPGLRRMIMVMNAAYGEPTRESMPFDLAHLRLPITYNLPEDATTETRKAEFEGLVRALDRALRAIFEGPEFRPSSPKTPEPLAFPEARSPAGMEYRFQSPGVALGVPDTPFGEANGGVGQVHLRPGAVMWLRVMPSYDTGRRWSTMELRQLTLPLANLPLTTPISSGSIAVVRGKDGCGWYPVEEPGSAASVCYVFNTGEVWAIDTHHLQMPGWIDFREELFVDSLVMCCNFLEKSLEVPAPYRWIVGMMGITDRYLPSGNRLSRGLGPCVVDPVKKDGVFREGDDPTELLRPFFEAVFDACGARRPATAKP
jgi:hypothetical protein